MFRLEVNGRVALDLPDVFYRDVQKQSTTPPDPDPDAAPAVPGPSAPPDVGDGLLGPILGDLLGGLILEDDGSQVPASAAQKGSSGVIDPDGSLNVAANSPDVKKSVERRTEQHGDVALHVTRDDSEPLGFKGFFFRYVLSVFTTHSGQAKFSDALSTFFGGHDKEWATPKDQHVWFKDFELSIDDLE